MLNLTGIMATAFDLNTFAARMVIAKGGVSIEGRTIGMDEIETNTDELVGKEITVRGHGKITLTGDTFDAPLPTPMDQQLLLGGM